MNHSVLQLLQERFNGDYLNADITSVGGGCINECYRINSGKNTAFCKLNSTSRFPDLFLKERNGLQLVSKQAAIRVPRVIDCFEHGDTQVLLMEWINEGERTEKFWEAFGQQLAEMHKISSDWFGLVEDNYMGSVKQLNTPLANWNDFFISNRLQPLVQQCSDTNLLSAKHRKQFEALYRLAPSVFGEDEAPSLLHGDLWSGNFMCDEKSNPVLIDPAVYYGHRSVDLAMTTLFGGFRPPFYEAYHYHFPLPSNYEEQWQVCNLYPLLIHLLLFGKSYLPGIEATLDKMTGK